MKCQVNSQSLKTAFRYIWNMHTVAEQKKGIHVIIDVTSSTVRLMGLNAVAVYSSHVDGAKSIETGSMQVHSEVIKEWINEKDADWLIEGEEDWIESSSTNQTLKSQAVEVELNDEEWSEIAAASSDDVLAMLKELLSSPLKSARSFTDSFLLRFNGKRLNGRLMTLQTIITSSIVVRSTVKGLTDIYLSKKEAQNLNKALKTMKMSDTITFSRENRRIKLGSNGYEVALINPGSQVEMPDITALMKRVYTLPKDQGLLVSVAEWKKALLKKQKAEKDSDKDSEELRYYLTSEGTWSDEPQSGTPIRVKDTLKLLKSMDTGQFTLHTIPCAVVITYETPTRSHASILTTGKE